MLVAHSILQVQSKMLGFEWVNVGLLVCSIHILHLIFGHCFSHTSVLLVEREHKCPKYR